VKSFTPVDGGGPVFVTETADFIHPGQWAELEADVAKGYLDADMLRPVKKGEALIPAPRPDVSAFTPPSEATAAEK
jgi:hypothetical protein